MKNKQQTNNALLAFSFKSDKQIVFRQYNIIIENAKTLVKKLNKEIYIILKIVLLIALVKKPNIYIFQTPQKIQFPIKMLHFNRRMCASYKEIQPSFFQTTIENSPPFAPPLPLSSTKDNQFLHFKL